MDLPYLTVVEKVDIIAEETTQQEDSVSSSSNSRDFNF